MEGKRCRDVILGRKESLVIQRGKSLDQRERKQRGSEMERKREREQSTRHYIRKTLPQHH